MMGFAEFYGVCRCLTLVQPVSKAVEDDSLFTRGNQADRSVIYCWSVEDIVFKYEDLDKEKQKEGPTLVSVSLYEKSLSVLL